MMRRMLLCVMLMQFSTALPACAEGKGHWVGTWAASPMAVGAGTSNAGSVDQTLREVVHVSLGGNSLRIVLSNEFGVEPLRVGAASVGLRSAGADLAASVAVTFHGKAEVSIPAGALVVSDAVALKLPALSDVAVSLYIPAQTLTMLTQHSFAAGTNYVAAGNQVGEKTLTGAKEMSSWRYLKGVDVLASEKSAAIVAFGDSITDGARSTPNTNSRWPDVLAARLAADRKTAHLGVLNEGIGGNRILHDVTGPNALARFDRDVLAQSGVKYVVILESINDIGHATDLVKPYDVVSADDLIAGFSQMVERAHTHGIKVIGATLTPYVGAKYASPEGEAMRQAVNAWIRTTKELDGVIDFEKATRDPAKPEMFLPANDGGDHLHPKDAGYKAMGDSIDLRLFCKVRSRLSAGTTESKT